MHLVRDYVTTYQLAERWSLAPETLRRWRMEKKGPDYIKIGDASKNAIRYRIADIEKYEKEHLHGKDIHNG